MGLRSWILGPYAKDLEELKSEVKELRAEVRGLAKNYQDLLKELLKIQRALEDKANKKAVERELESLSKLVMAVYDKIKELEALGEVSLGESLLTPQFFMGFSVMMPSHRSPSSAQTSSMVMAPTGQSLATFTTRS